MRAFNLKLITLALPVLMAASPTLAQSESAKPDATATASSIEEAGQDGFTDRYQAGLDLLRDQNFTKARAIFESLLEEDLSTTERQKVQARLDEADRFEATATAGQQDGVSDAARDDLSSFGPGWEVSIVGGLNVLDYQFEPGNILFALPYAGLWASPLRGAYWIDGQNAVTFSLQLLKLGIGNQEGFGDFRAGYRRSLLKEGVARPYIQVGIGGLYDRYGTNFDLHLGLGAELGVQVPIHEVVAFRGFAGTRYFPEYNDSFTEIGVGLSFFARK